MERTIPVHFIRKKRLNGGRISAGILVDGALIGTLKNNSGFAASLTAGVHEITSEPDVFRNMLGQAVKMTGGNNTVTVAIPDDASSACIELKFSDGFIPGFYIKRTEINR